MNQPIEEPEDQVPEFRFEGMNLAELRWELGRQREQWKRGRTTWRAWKLAEKALTSEINFRLSNPTE